MAYHPFRSRDSGGGRGGGVYFPDPPIRFTGASVAACRTARDTYFTGDANLPRLQPYRTDQYLGILLAPAGAGQVIETYLPGKETAAYDSGNWVDRGSSSVTDAHIDSRIASPARANNPSGTFADTRIPAGIARDSEVSAAVTALRGGVSSAFDTLGELAAGLVQRLSLAGGTMTGKITLDGAPTEDLHAATKKYVDDNAGGGAATPSISAFGVTGQRSPAAGSIAGMTYDYELSVAQAAHAGAVRIVGYTGTRSTALPDSVTLLATIAQADWPHAAGTVTIPPGISLNADETYTIEAQVFADGQAPATDTPVSWQDYRITAHAPAGANYRVGYIEWDNTADDAASIASDFAGSGVFTFSSQTIPDSIEFDLASGDVGGGSEFQLVLFAKTDQTQPTGFTSAGQPATNSFYGAEDATLGSTAYKAYILRPIFRLGDDDDGTTFGVTHD